MTKYTGKHRIQKTWRPQKWLPKHTIASALIAVGIVSLHPSTAHTEPLRETHEPPLFTPPLRFTPIEQVSIVPEPPDLPGNGDDELNAWLAQGGPGYIPDSKDAKGLKAEKPEVAVVQATCDKPDPFALSDHALYAYRTICALFPEITTFGGFRAGDQDHGTGNAIDSMVYGDTATGDDLAAFLIAHADELNVKYIIWKQRIWQNVTLEDGTSLRYWQTMEDRGSPTANHLDHVHLSVN